MNYSYYFPTKLVLSEDAGADVVKELEGAVADSVFVLTDQGIMQAGIGGKLLTKIEAAGFKPLVYDQVPGNPNVPDVKTALEVVAGKSISHVVAIGGGSVIDTAKAAGLLLGDDELDYEEVQWRRQSIKKPSLPVIGVPTTAGTGSEVTHVAVVGDSKGFKMGVLNPALFLKAAVIDGGLMLSLPAKLTAATGMDALVHAMEAYLSKRATPMSDLFALAAIKNIVRWLPEAYRNGQNLEARKAMAEAASWAGISFDQSSLGLVHALAGPLCGTYHLHHGLGVAALLPATLDFDAPAIPAERWQALRQAIAMPSDTKPEALGDWSRNLLTNLGIPTSLAGVGVKAEDIPTMAESATRMAMIGFNVRPADIDDCKQVLTAGL